MQKCNWKTQARKGKVERRRTKFWPLLSHEYPHELAAGMERCLSEKGLPV